MAGDEAGISLTVIGASGVALVLALRRICALLGQREMQQGRALTEEEIDALLTLASSHKAIEARLRGVERRLDRILDVLNSFDPPPAWLETDGG